MGGPVKLTSGSVGIEDRRFEPISGHRALDLLATLRDRHRDPVEYLREPSDLDRWLVAAGLPVATPAGARDVDDARRLRETVNRITRALVAADTPTAADVRELNGWARRPALVPQITRGLERRWTADHPVAAALALIAREAVDLLTGPERALIRECAAAPACSRLYLDRSRAGRRRWCQMDVCGTRAKMTRYRQRKSAAE